MDEKKQLKILIVSQYFWPENFRVNDIVKYFQNQGAHIEILTGKPNYPGGNIFEDYKNNQSKYLNFNGSKVFRVPMYPRKNGSNTNLFFNYLSFLLSSIFFDKFFKNSFILTISFLSGIGISKLNRSSFFIPVITDPIAALVNFLRFN